MKSNKSHNAGNFVPNYTSADHSVRLEKHASKKVVESNPVKPAEQIKIVRRYSYNNNGGGYAGL